MRIVPMLTRLGAVAAVLTVAIGVQSASTAAPSAPSTVITVDPARILDTRDGTGAPAAPVGAGEAISLQVTGVGGVPTDATGVIITLTATEATAASFVNAWPTGETEPNTSVLNFTTGEDIANTVTMALGAGGKIDLRNSAGSVELVADVTGYLVPAGTTAPVAGAIEINAYGAASIGAVTPTTNGCLRLGANGELFLDVPLPHGAVISEVEFRYFDDDPGANFFMALQEIAGGFPGTPGGAVDAQTQTTGAAGFGSATVVPVGAEAVSSDIRYWISSFTLGVTTGQHWFCGATVRYLQT